MIRILGIDPGSQVTGFGVIEYLKGRTSYAASGCIRVAGYSFQERLKRIFNSLTQVIAEHQPQVIAIEKIFVCKNVASTLKLAQARGVAMVVAALHDLEVSEYSPRHIKKTVVGYGAADKQQVQHMIKALFQLDGLPQVDAADALAVALCHAHIQGTTARIACRESRVIKGD